MTDEEMADEYIKSNNLEWELECYRTSPIGEIKQAYLAGLETGIGMLRYCCTCKKWKECKVVSMYGICADWEIKEN